jgi:hypothetical protein
VGIADNLPNRSGWIRAKDLPKGLKKLKAAFIDKYPTYAATLYPQNGHNIHGTFWKYDPNNEEYKTNWGLPWPPVEDQVMSKKEKKKSPIRPNTVTGDTTYRYQSDDDSDDHLVSDANEPRQQRKRKRPIDAPFYPDQHSESDSGDPEGSLPKSQEKKRKKNDDATFRSDSNADIVESPGSDDPARAPSGTGVIKQKRPRTRRIRRQDQTLIPAPQQDMR